MKVVAIFVVLFLIAFYLLYDLNFRIDGLSETVKTQGFKITNLTLNFNFLKKNFNLLNNTLKQLNEKIKNIVLDIAELRAKIYLMENDIKILKEIGFKSGLKNPTLKVLKDFIRKDDTDNYQYIKGKFTCINFANKFVKNFAKEGYYSCVTIIFLHNQTHSHALVAVNTKDVGLIYVEPQTDKIIYDLKVGDDYCKKVGWKCSWKIERIVSCFS